MLVVSQARGDGNLQRYVLKDSKRIVHTLMCHEGKATSGTDPKRKAAELAWIRWSDDVLVQLIVMNIYRSLKVRAGKGDL